MPSARAGALAFFTLEARRAFLEPAPPATRRDVEPWRFSRRLSYLRRPLLRRGNDLVFAENAVVSAKLYLGMLCRTGRLRREPGTELDRALNALRALDGESFNDDVAALFTAPRYAVRTRVTNIGGHELARPDGSVIGDVDVLVLDREQRTLYSIETKDIAQGRNHAEIAAEISEILRDAPSHRCVLTKHLEREIWLREHIPDVLRGFAIADDPARWRVHSLIVFDKVMASMQRRSAIELVSLSELSARLQDGGLFGDRRD